MTYQLFADSVASWHHLQTFRRAAWVLVQGGLTAILEQLQLQPLSVERACASQKPALPKSCSVQCLQKGKTAFNSSFCWQEWKYSLAWPLAATESWEETLFTCTQFDSECSGFVTLHVSVLGFAVSHILDRALWPIRKRLTIRQPFLQNHLSLCPEPIYAEANVLKSCLDTPCIGIGLSAELKDQTPHMECTILK